MRSFKAIAKIPIGNIPSSSHDEPLKPNQGHPARFAIKYKDQNKKIWSHVVFLVQYSNKILHLIDSEKSLSMELGDRGHYTILFPSGYHEEIIGKLAYKTASNGAFGIHLIKSTDGFRQQLGQVLLQSFADMSPRSIRQLGLKPGSLKNKAHFTIVKSPEEYAKVLELRYEAYSRAGKVPENGAKESVMADLFDSRSIILLASFRDKAVASLRLILNGQSDITEHEQFVPFSSELPSRHDTIEITRVCTHPDYRGSDLLQGLFQFASQIAMTIDRNYILGSSTPKLLRLYRKIGFHVTHLQYQHTNLNHQSHTIFVGKKHDIILGRKVSLLHWNILYRDIYENVRPETIVPFMTRRDHLRLITYRFFGNIWFKFEKIVKALRNRRSHLYQDDSRREDSALKR